GMVKGSSACPGKLPVVLPKGGKYKGSTDRAILQVI
uniref:Uncharacterized protein n=1 Tax=Aegilops tauschii subsp. strangulata TaxID=200361 RepID=A0A453DT81_AEGTS